MEANVSKALLLAGSLDIRNKDSVGALIAQLDTSVILENLPAIKEKKWLLLPALKIAAEDFDLYLKHLDLLPSLNAVSKEELEKYPSLKTMVHCEFTAKLSEKKPEENEALEEKIEGNVKIKEIEPLFDQITLTDETSPFYLKPSSQALNDDGTACTLKHLRDGMGVLLGRIEKREAYTAVPSDETKRDEWYQQLERRLKQVIAKMTQEQDKALVVGELLHLGAAGHHCGARWMNDVNQAHLALSGGWQRQLQEASGIEGNIDACKDLYITGIMEAFMLQYTPKVGASMQPHLFNLIATHLIGRGIALSSAVLEGVDLEDSFISTMQTLIAEADIKFFLDDYLSPLKFTTFIKGHIEERLKEDPIFLGSVIASLRNYAEKQLLELFPEKQKRCKSSTKC